MLLALVASARAQLLGFVQSDEEQFLAAYAELTADSYSAPLPPALTSVCAAKGPAYSGVAAELPAIERIFERAKN